MTVTEPATASGEEAPDDDSDGHETPQPGPPDHASGAIAEVALGGQDLVEVGQTNSQVNDNGTSQGDVTVLAIGGQEVIGAHSDSEGEQSASSDPFAPLCEGTMGAICLGLLFADTNSSSTDQASHSDASTALVGLCVGKSNDDPSTPCDGPVLASAASGSSSIDRDKTTGAETASQENNLANLCVGGETETGSCGGVGDETAITIPPGCPSGASLVCVFFNQSAMTLSTGVAGSRQEALHASVLPGVVGGSDLALAHAGIAETFVRWSTPTCCGGGGGGGGGELAFTGLGMMVPLSVPTVLLAMATSLMAVSRRRLVVS